MQFRIGINLGDVIVEGDRIYGDGVNIAARVQDLAEPGGICITSTIYDQVENKLPFEYELLGEQPVKNIAKPVRVYRLRATRPEAMSAPARALEPMAKPSIAVLPFDNMSRDPDQGYFSDGITEDLITDLSKLSGLFVIARNSTFAYRGRPVKVQQVGRELGVRYVLEGSVRKAGDRVRITAQLVDTGTGHHVWADRYDRRVDDVFEVQDEITRSIVEALAVALTLPEQRNQRERRRTEVADAYDFFLRGLEHLRSTTRDSNLQARRMAERAIALDAGYAEAHALEAMTYFRDWSMSWSQDPRTLDRALEAAERAVALDATLPLAHRALGIVLLWKKQHERALATARRAVQLAPNDADGYWSIGEILSWWRPADAIDPVEKAMLLNPHYPPTYLYTLGHAYYLIRRYEDAVNAFERLTRRNPDFLPAHAFLAATYAELGRVDDARRANGEVLRISPRVTAHEISNRLPYEDPELLVRAVAAFRVAGLPD
jgi:adenylate cyclase